jgi:hypothetical protein
MTENELQTSQLQVKAGGRSEIPAVIDIDPDQVASPALKRLLEEVQNEDMGCSGEPYAYDRAHNKHNR